MKDFATKGTGNSRLLKTSIATGTTWEQALEMLRSGTFPVDFAGFNSEGIQTMGTLLNKLNLLSDDLATALGLDPDTATVKDALQAVKTLASNASTTANNAVPKAGGTMTGKLVLNGDPTANLHAATKQYVDNSTTPAVLHVLVGSGVALTCTKGTTVLSATGGSDGVATVYPAEFGNWTLAANSKTKVFNINAIAEFYTAVVPALANCSWSTIAAVANLGIAEEAFSIGDTKTFSLNGVNYTAVIIGFNHDELTAGGKAGITFQTQTCLATTYPMNSSDTNANGWNGCAMRTSTMATLLSQIESSLQSVIKQVNKKASAGSQSANITVSADKLFLLSEVEIFGATTYAKAGEGSQYAYYTAGNDKKKTVNGSASNWWERSPYGSTSAYFCLVNGTGDANGYGAGNLYGVAFGFCI